MWWYSGITPKVKNEFPPYEINGSARFTQRNIALSCQLKASQVRMASHWYKPWKKKHSKHQLNWNEDIQYNYNRDFIKVKLHSNRNHDMEWRWILLFVLDLQLSVLHRALRQLLLMSTCYSFCCILTFPLAGKVPFTPPNGNHHCICV